MLNRLLLAVGGLIAAALVATPAVMGLSGNSSFSRDIQVPVPSGAHQVHFVTPSDRSPEHSPSTGAQDRPHHHTASSDAVDDHGGLRASSSSAPGGLDDGPTHDVGDDHGDRSGRDGSGHRGRG